ncbi:T9SS C-terminal target domain-containing protein, partial [bacterium]
ESENGPVLEIETGGPDVVGGEKGETPREYRLDQNFPNPFNPKTVVSSQLPAAGEVRLAIYDLLGREVAVLVEERRAAGIYHDAFDASGLASGTYLYRLKANGFVKTRTMLVVK